VVLCALALGACGVPAGFADAPSETPALQDTVADRLATETAVDAPTSDAVFDTMMAGDLVSVDVVDSSSVDVPGADVPRADVVPADVVEAGMDVLADVRTDAGACGATGQPCCAMGRCNAELTCNPGANTCGRCGGFGQMCCGAACFTASTMCDFDGICTMRGVCGFPMTACCAPDACFVGSLCNAARSCEPCGAAGQPCCPTNNCNTGLACAAGRCG